MKQAFSRSMLRAVGGLALSILAATPGSATIAVMSSDAELTRSSRLIAQGEVRSVSSQRSGGEIYTYIELDVHRTLKGQVRGRKIVIKQPGGIVDGTIEWVHGAPSFRVGQRALLFLDTWPDGALRVAHLFQGKYDILRDAKTGRMRVNRQTGGVPLLPNRTGGEVTGSADLAWFRQKIAGLLQRQEAETRGRTEAVVEVPREYRRPSRKGADGKLGSVAQPYALLIINGRYHRWFQPDSGQGVGIWFNLTQQPNGNAHASLQSGLDAWNNVPTSTIRLDFAGYNNAGGASRDYFNTISFEDPRFQIPDPGPDCGGIVAQTTNWISTTSARVVNRTTFYQILESDVVYNNGWGPGPCPLFVDDPSTKIIAEVAAHELGHSIGLGHSNLAPRAGEDPIMRATVHNIGRGAWLGFDDHVGANFIYPEPGNPIDDASYFVGWHYRDWLEREPDRAGWSDWTNVIQQCGNDAACIQAQRRHTAHGFVFSTEFHLVIDSRFHTSNIGTPAYNQAFVEECYERYWRRPMDSTYWVDWLNAQRPNTAEQYKTVLGAFIENDEYRSRFDPDLCNPHDEQVCYDFGGFWNYSTCSCQYYNPDPCGGGTYCL